jgi:hypothetical protein
MIGLDWVLIAIIIIITGVQSFRGTKDFDVVLYEMLTFIISASLSVQWYEQLAEQINVNPLLTLLFLYIVIEVVLLIFANILAKRTEFSWEPFNAYLSFFFGIITAWAILYVLLRIASLEASGKIPLFNSSSIEKSVIAQEIMQFKIFHTIMVFLNNIGTGE